METVTLPAGEAASAEADCIRIQETQSGLFTLAGTVLAVCGDPEAEEVLSLVASDPYESYEAAEAAGLAWANDQCVQLLYISRSKGTEPLPDVVG